MMEIISGLRQTGRTTNLLKRLTKNKKAVLIVITMREKDRLIDLNKKYKDRIFTFNELVNERLRGTRFEEIYFDNLDYMLQSLSGISKSVATVEWGENNEHPRN